MLNRIRHELVSIIRADVQERGPQEQFSVRAERALVFNMSL